MTLIPSHFSPVSIPVQVPMAMGSAVNITERLVSRPHPAFVHAWREPENSFFNTTVLTLVFLIDSTCVK